MPQWSVTQDLRYGNEDLKPCKLCEAILMLEVKAKSSENVTIRKDFNLLPVESVAVFSLL